jgi:hypothetical protein
VVQIGVQLGVDQHRIRERVLEFIKNSGGKFILDRKLVEQICNSDPAEIEDALEEFVRQLSEMKKIPKHQRISVIDEFDRAEEFMRDIQSDLELMQEIRKKAEKLDLVTNDPKAKNLIAEIEKILKTAPAKGEPKRKVIIFSEYTDTVRHLEPILENAFKGKVVGSNSGLSASQLKETLANFDASVKPKKNSRMIFKFFFQATNFRKASTSTAQARSLTSTSPGIQTVSFSA